MCRRKGGYISLELFYYCGLVRTVSVHATCLPVSVHATCLPVSVHATCLPVMFDEVGKHKLSRQVLRIYNCRQQAIVAK